MSRSVHRASISRRRMTGGARPRWARPPRPGRCGARAGAQERQKVTIALDWYPNANHAGLYLAQERGYFADAGLEVELYTPSDPTVVLQTVGAGRDDFGISYQTDVLLARAEEVPVVSVAALVQHPLHGRDGAGEQRYRAAVRSGGQRRSAIPASPASKPFCKR